MSTTLESPRAFSMTVKLEVSERDRLKSLAVARKRTPHYLMKEAIQTYLEKAESEELFIQAALRSRQHLKETGLHVTQNEFSAWVKAIQQNPKTPMPTCHD